MAKIRNNYTSDLGIGGNVVIPKGAAIEVPQWPELSANAVVKAWVKLGVVEVVGEKANEKANEKAGEASQTAPATDIATGSQTPDGEAPEAPAVDDRDRLVAELAELGIKKPANTSLKNLQKALDEARAS